MGEARTALRLERVHKRFGSTRAVEDVTLEVKAGEIHALVGENGAGKSTLMRLVAGLHPVDSGEIVIDGVVMKGHSPAKAARHGVGMVHQHFMLVPALTVAENVILGQEPTHGPAGLLLDMPSAEARVAELSARYGLKVEPRRRVDQLGVGEAQRVEILKVLYRGARLLILDEPTAVLTPREVEELWGVLSSLVTAAEPATTAIVITH